MTIRPAEPSDREVIESILDAAMLETDPDRTATAVADGRAFVAEREGRILGAVVCVPREEGVHVDAIAVRKRRQDQGIGTALVERVLEDHDRVVAEFDERVRPFYASLGFEIEVLENGQFRGRMR